MTRELGKIKGVKLGYGGYDDAMFGVSFQIGMGSSGFGDFWGVWAVRPQEAKWTLEEHRKSLADVMFRLLELMDKAKVRSLDELVGVPIETEWEDMRLKSWRVLTEVL